MGLKFEDQLDEKVFTGPIGHQALAATVHAYCGIQKSHSLPLNAYMLKATIMKDQNMLRQDEKRHPNPNPNAVVLGRPLDFL